MLCGRGSSLDVSVEKQSVETVPRMPVIHIHDWIAENATASAVVLPRGTVGDEDRPGRSGDVPLLDAVPEAVWYAREIERVDSIAERDLWVPSARNCFQIRRTAKHAGLLWNQRFDQVHPPTRSVDIRGRCHPAVIHIQAHRPTRSDAGCPSKRPPAPCASRDPRSGRSSPASSVMIAMTTSSSMSVNPKWPPRSSASSPNRPTDAIV